MSFSRVSGKGRGFGWGSWHVGTEGGARGAMLRWIGAGSFVRSTVPRYVIEI